MMVEETGLFGMREIMQGDSHLKAVRTSGPISGGTFDLYQHADSSVAPVKKGNAS